MSVTAKFSRKRKNILFYYPANYNSVALASLMEAFQQQGHEVYLLTLTSKGDLHRTVENFGVKTYGIEVNKTSSFIYYFKQIIYLSRFVNTHKINIVYSHLQHANFIAVFAQFLSKAKFIICRHHSDCAFVDNNRTEKIFDKIINKLGKTFIVPSQKVYDQMVLIEKAQKNKIKLIRYAYNFEHYPFPNLKEVNLIRKNYKAEILLVKVARLIPEKRHLTLFNVIYNLVTIGLDIKLLVLSEGPERKKLEEFVELNKLGNNIYLLGHKKNVIDYLSASDLIVHLSESEASNNLIKEAALVEKPVVVCNDVGDFDEYVLNNETGFVLNKNQPEEELFSLLKEIYFHKSLVENFGVNLKQKVLNMFSVENIIKEYQLFNK